MKEVKVLGTGCKKCERLEQRVRQVIADNNLEAEVEKISDIDDMMQYGIMMTPGLVIDGKVVSNGIIPKEEQILAWLTS